MTDCMKMNQTGKWKVKEAAIALEGNAAAELEKAGKASAAGKTAN